MMSVKQLMTVPPTEFIGAAYKVLYGRRPDPDGSTYYLNRLADGYSRISVLKQMMRSSEFNQSRSASLEGDWKKLVTSSSSSFGRWLNPIQHVWDNREARRFKRRLEHQYQTISENIRQTLDGGLAESLHQLTLMNERLADGYSNGSPASDGNRSALVDLRLEELEGVSDSARDIYLKLRRSTQRRSA